MDLENTNWATHYKIGDQMWVMTGALKHATPCKVISINKELGYPYTVVIELPEEDIPIQPALKENFQRNWRRIASGGKWHWIIEPLEHNDLSFKYKEDYSIDELIQQLNNELN